MLPQDEGQYPRASQSKLHYWIGLLLLSFVFSLFPIHTLTKASTYNDIEDHWASPYIQWALNENLIEGYEDHTFQPNKPVSEAEFLALLMRAYGLVHSKEEKSGNEWNKPYYSYAISKGWPTTFNNERGSFRRGQAAILIASSVNGKPFELNAAIQWLLDEGISKGRTSATINGFAANGGVTRAEALTFLYMLKGHTSELSSTTIPQQQTSILSIGINDHVNKLLFMLGKPDRIDPSEYDYKWYIYLTNKGNYTRYSMFGVHDNKVVALFSNSPDSWSSTEGIKLGQSLAEAKNKIINETNVKTKESYYAYASKGIAVTLFIDAHMKNKIVGMHQQVDGLKIHEFSTMKEEHRVAMEKQLFELVNAERAQRAIPLLQWDALAGSAARAHSEDMMKNNFFSHKNLKEKSPFDRMRAKGITFRIASENIAAGFSNSIFAHYTLLNSTTGHRDSILNDELERLGTGVAFGGSYKVYYTQDYYTPLDKAKK